MAFVLALTLAALLPGAEGAQRTEVLRKSVGECTLLTDKTMMFTQGQITGMLPSQPVKQAETDVVGADLIQIEYASNYKILTEKMSKEMYVLTQCGSMPPSNADLTGYLAKYVNYTVKHFTIPLQVAASGSTVHLAFFEALGVQDRIKYVSKYASGACWQKGLSCGGELNVTAHLPEVDALFMDCGFGPDCSNVNSQPKGIHFSPSQDPGPLRSAEHIKFMAAFFNKEEIATTLFARTLAAYTDASVTASPKPVVAWLSYASWGGAKFVLSQSSYKLNMVTDAGGSNVNGAAVAARMGANMSVVSASTGKTYNAELSKFNESKTDAAAAFFAALGDVDVVIDETYAYAPKSYTLDSFLSTMGLNTNSSFKFLQNQMVLRVDGLISENDGLDWFESRLAHPDWAVGGLASQIHTSVSKPKKYFRNIAKGEAPEVITKAMCTTTLPTCDAKAYPAVINMMYATTTTTTVVAATTTTTTVGAAANTTTTTSTMVATTTTTSIMGDVVGLAAEKYLGLSLVLAMGALHA